MLQTFNDEVLLHDSRELRIAARLEPAKRDISSNSHSHKHQSSGIVERVAQRFCLLLATEAVLRSLDVKDVAGVLYGDDVTVADTLEAVAGTDHGFLNAHLVKNRVE